MTSIDIEYLRNWVGRERVRRDVLAPFPAEALAAAFNREHPPGLAGALPPTWQWLYFNEPVYQRDTGSDGHPRTGGFLPPVPLPRRMWASGEFSYEHSICLGEPAERRSVVSDVELKQGSTGALVFVTVEHRTEQRGQLCLFEKQHLVYREMPAGPSPLPTGEAPSAEAEFRVPFEPDPVLLFRYSALTYNGHRIHYDRHYAMQQEHYPGLVVHGPLLATLLAEQVARQFPEQSVSGFRFRAVRPVFDFDRLQLCGRRDGDAVKLWTVNQDGFVTMTATATLGATP
ncbi:Mesaconyl-C(4)-CoA hydratase [compost metagenome]